MFKVICIATLLLTIVISSKVQQFDLLSFAKKGGFFHNGDRKQAVAKHDDVVEKDYDPVAHTPGKSHFKPFLKAKQGNQADFKRDIHAEDRPQRFDDQKSSPIGHERSERPDDWKDKIELEAKEFKQNLDRNRNEGSYQNFKRKRGERMRGGNRINDFYHRE